MKQTICIIWAIMVVSCIGCRERRNMPHKESDRKTDTIVYKPIFLSRKLQDSLDTFINAIDSFPNKFGPTIYTVACTYNEVTKDADIFLMAEGVTLVDAVILANFNYNFQEDKLRIHGARKVNGHIIAVCSYDVDEPEKIFNLDVLDKKLYYEHDYASGKYLDYTPRPSVRHYRLIGCDSLKVIHIAKSRYEK